MPEEITEVEDLNVILQRMQNKMQVMTQQEVIDIAKSLRTELYNRPVIYRGIEPHIKADMLKIAKDIEYENFRILPNSETKKLSVEAIMERANTLIEYVKTK